jgi:glycogen(starch) synthase
MRVLIVNYEFPPLGGGAATASWHISRELAKKGCEVTVLTSRFKGLKRSEVIDGVKILRIPVVRRRKDRCSVGEMITFMVSGMVSGLKVMKREKIDATLAFFTIPCGHIGLLGRWLRGIPYVVSLRGGDVPGAMGKELDMYHKICLPMTKLIWENARFIAANSKGLVELAQKSYKGNILLIRNGVDVEFFSPLERENVAKRKLIFVGRLSREKDLPTLLNAVKVLNEKRQFPFELETIGDGPERKPWEDEAKELHVAQMVTFRGWLDRETVRNEYRNADIFVLPSLGEGMPNVVLEAMASGLPVVATRVRGIVDLVEDGVSGFLFEPRNAEALMEKLALLLENDALRMKMGKAARQRAKEFSWERVAEEYRNLLADAIKAKEGNE